MYLCFLRSVHCSVVRATNRGYLQYLALYTPTRVSAGVSGNKSLPDPIPYPLFLETIKESRYSTFPGMCWNTRESLQMAPETYIWYYMQQRGFELFKGGLFCMIWWEIIAHAHSWRFMFDFFFEYFWLICCFLTFCSLGYNQLSDESARVLSEALQVNQSLQKLKWVQPVLSNFLDSVLWL